MPRTRIARNVAAVGSAAALVLLTTALPADAAIGPSGTDTIDDTYVQSCDLADGVHVDIEVHDFGIDAWRLKVRGPLAGFSYLDTFYGDGRGSIGSTYTNLATGRSWTSYFHDRDIDRQVVSVDGDVRTMVAQNAVHFSVYDDRGRPAWHQDYLVTYTFTYDTKGTETLDDDVDTFGDVSSVSGRIGGRDFCEDAYDFTVA